MTTFLSITAREELKHAVPVASGAPADTEDAAADEEGGSGGTGIGGGGGGTGRGGTEGHNSIEKLK